MRKAYLDHLPSKNNRILWSECVGCVVPFVCDDVDGELIIDSYDSSTKKLIITYDGFQNSIRTSTLKSGLGLKYLVEKKAVSREQVYQVGDHVETRTGTLLVQKVEGDVSHGWTYHYKCDICGYEGSMTKHKLWGRHGCPACAGSVVVPGINDFNSKYPSLVKYLVKPSDGKKVTAGSEKKLRCKCPICGTEKMASPYAISHGKFSCNQCSDGFSYASKALTALLRQVGIVFESEYNPKWAGDKRYDHYIPILNTIIEEHGIQHYEDTSRSKKDDQVANDLKKEIMARENGIIEYIQLDCRVSDIMYIRKSIRQTHLLSLLGVSDGEVDWDQIDYLASSTSYMRKACDLWNTGKYATTSQVAKEIGLSAKTISKYLVRGNKLGMTQYDAMEECNKVRKMNSDNMKMAIQQCLLENPSVVVATYDSISEASRLTGIDKSHLAKVCKANTDGVSKPRMAGGYHWRYAKKVA